MAKAQVKKKAAAKRGAPKAVSRPKPRTKPKTAAKTAAKSTAKKAPVKAARPKRMAAKARTAVKKAAAKVTRKVVKKAVHIATKQVAKKVVAKAAKDVARATVVAAAAAPAAVKTAKAISQRPAAADEKKRSRRSRLRIHSDGTPLAAWLTPGEKPRPSSFIPAPPRAEAPSLVAAPPASSDRLFRDDDISEMTVRTVPVRVDIEQSAGRVFIAVNPEEVTVRTGEGIEWDFRYLGGADVTVDEVMIDFARPSPFSSATFRSRKPGIARPHRQLSGAVSTAAGGKRVQYSIRAMTGFKSELSVTRPWVRIEKA